MATDHPYYSVINGDDMYKDVPTADMPSCESLERVNGIKKTNSVDGLMQT
jgi:hypothetical protein